MKSVGYRMSGEDGGGLAEDSVILYKGDAGVLLQFVVDGRDVDSQTSEPEDLTPTFFEPCEWTTIKSVDQMQALIDEALPDECYRWKAGDFFRIGLDAYNEQDEEEEEEEEEEYDEDESES